MVVNEECWMQLLEEIAELKNVRVTIAESNKGGLIAFYTTVIGGIVLGPPGFAVGGIIGGITAAWQSSGKFKSITTAIKDDFTIAEKKELFRRITEVFSHLEDIEDIKELIRITKNNPFIKQMIKDKIVMFVKNKFEVVYDYELKQS